MAWEGALPHKHLPSDPLADEGLWDILIKDIPKEVTSYTFSMDILKPGVSYDFRVIAVNDYGFGTPSSPSQSVPGTACGVGRKRPMEEPGDRGWCWAERRGAGGIAPAALGRELKCIVFSVLQG